MFLDISISLTYMWPKFWKEILKIHALVWNYRTVTIHHALHFVCTLDYEKLTIPLKAARDHDNFQFEDNSL